MNNNSTSFYNIFPHDKKSFLSFSLSIIFTILYLIMVVLIIDKIYKPDIQRILQLFNDLITLNDWNKDMIFLISPEPVERMQFVFCVILMPLFLIIFYRVFNVIFANRSKQELSFFYFFISILQIISLAIIIYFTSLPSSFFFACFFIFFEHYRLYVFLIFPLIILTLILYNKYILFRRVVNISSIVFLSVLFIIVFLFNIFNTNAYWGWMYHFNPVFYPITQVAAGKTLLVDFVNSYGLYPHFLNPVFSITGLSVLKFSTVMSGLNVISFLLILLGLYKIIKNRFILLIGFCTFLFFDYLIPHGFYYYDVYFQYFPIRVLFPALLIFLSIWYLEYRKKTIYFLSFLLFSIGILWNTDTGIIVFLSWLLMLSYDELCLLATIRTKIVNISKHIMFSIIMIITTLLVFSFLIYLRSGSLPDFTKIFEYQQICYFSGFNMSPMPVFAEWYIVVLIYLTGLAVSIKGLIDKVKNNYHSIIFLLSVLGLGLFSYYQGNSGNVNLCFAGYPAILLLIIFTDIAHNSIMKKKYTINTVFFFLILIFFSGSAVPSIIMHGKVLKNWAIAGFDSFNNEDPDSVVSQNIYLIRKHTNPGEKILILSSQYDGLYYGETKTECVLNIPGSTELLLKKDYNKIINEIKNNDNCKIFVDVLTNDYYLNNLLIQNNYGIIDQSNNAQMLLVKKNTGLLLSEHNFIHPPYKTYNWAQMAKYMSNAFCYFILGNEYSVNSCFAEAKKAYKQVIILDPAKINAYINLGYACCKLEQWDEAILYLNKALEIDPDNKLAKGNLNWAINSKHNNK